MAKKIARAGSVLFLSGNIFRTIKRALCEGHSRKRSDIFSVYLRCVVYVFDGEMIK